MDPTANRLNGAQYNNSAVTQVLNSWRIVPDNWKVQTHVLNIITTKNPKLDYKIVESERLPCSTLSLLNVSFCCEMESIGMATISRLKMRFSFPCFRVPGNYSRDPSLHGNSNIRKDKSGAGNSMNRKQDQPPQFDFST